MKAQNLRLPLCPKCGDTKDVEVAKTQILIVSTTQFICENCKIRWWTVGDGDGCIREDYR